MTHFTPTDEQIEALARDDYMIAADAMGIKEPWDEWRGRDLHRLVTAGVTASPAFQDIIRTAQIALLRRIAEGAEDSAAWTENTFIPGPNSTAEIEYNRRLAQELRDIADELERS